MSICKRGRSCAHRLGCQSRFQNDPCWEISFYGLGSFALRFASYYNSINPIKVKRLAMFFKAKRSTDNVNRVHGKSVPTLPYRTMLSVLPSQWATVCLFPVFRKSTDDAKNTHAGTGKESNEDVEFLSLAAQIQQTSTRKHTSLYRFKRNNNAVCVEHVFFVRVKQ